MTPKYTHKMFRSREIRKQYKAKKELRTKECGMRSLKSNIALFRVKIHNKKL